MKKLGFGTMRLPLLDADNPKSIDLKQVEKMIDYYMSKGFNYFDTAYPYHGEMSEIAVRECLVRRYPRESFILADKMPILRVKDSADYQMYFDDQLKKCGVEYFDYYLLHNMGRDRYIKTKKYGGFEFLQKVKDEGRVGKVGFSFHDEADVLDMILTEHPEIDFVQLQINYFDWDGAVAQSGKCYETACRHNKPVIVMEPVKGGLLAQLTGKAGEAFESFYKNQLKEGTVLPSYASLAVRYAASCDNVFMVLSGMSNIGQVEDNVSYMENFKPLTKDERELTANITDILNETIKVDCTSCKYCMEECPMNINIPGYFGLYNLYSVTGKKTNMYYERFSMNYGKASECIGCGKCENICPQHIEVRKWLKEMAALYEQEQK